MRVIDLLALLSDQNKNAAVVVRLDDEQLNIDSFRQQIANEQPQLILTTLPKNRRILRLWEFQLLLNQPALFQHYVYVQTLNQPRAIFGFVLDHQRIVLS